MNSSMRTTRPSTPSHRSRRRPRAALGARTALAAVAGLALTFGLSACGGDEADPAASDTVRTASDGSEFNQADVDFVTKMIPHHAQAVQMVVMAQGRTLDPEVETLMQQIRDAQVPEIETMSDLLTTWEEPVPETSLDHANAGHGDGMDGMDGMEMDEMSGMMSESRMDDLDQAQGSGFQEMWLEMMTEHHEGAIEMAETEVEDGVSPDAIALAEQIIDSQTAEIETMKELR